MTNRLRFRKEVLGVALVLCAASLFILYPFLDALLFAVVTSYLLRYLHNILESRIENELISTGLIISGLVGLAATTVYLFVANFTEILMTLDSLQGSMNAFALNVVNTIGLSDEFSQQTVQFIGTFSDFLRGELVNVFTSLPIVLAHVAVFTVSSIYLYRDGERIESKLKEMIAGLPEEEREIANSIKESVEYVFKGVFVTEFLVAFSIAMVAWIGFYIIGQLTTPMPLAPIWAALMFFAALLPMVATLMVYGPVGLYYLMIGSPVKGTLILGFGAVFLHMLPALFLRPYIGSWRMKEHPLIIFLGFLVGPLALGIKGLILGPLILILTKEFILNSSRLFS